MIAMDEYLKHSAPYCHLLRSQALDYCHANGIMHRKPPMILGMLVDHFSYTCYNHLCRRYQAAQHRH